MRLLPLIASIALLISVQACGNGDGGDDKAGGDGGTLLGGAIQGNALVPANRVTTFAGAPRQPGTADGVGGAARFRVPYGVTTDGSYLYVSDNFNSTIRKIKISSGAVTTIAGLAGETGWADGRGTAAKFHSPMGITTDGSNLYVADWNNNLIRKIEISSGEVTTLAGSPGKPGDPGEVDGIGRAARFNGPIAITTDGKNLYVGEFYGETIRKIEIATRRVTTLAGRVGADGYSDGVGAEARFYAPIGLTTDGTYLYVTDSGNAVIRKVVIATGVVTTMAGQPGTHGFADGTGPSAIFYDPWGITTDGTNLYVTDFVYHLVRKIEITSGRVTTMAGMAHEPGSADGYGAEARFNYPQDLTTDGKSLYVVDSDNHIIRKID